MDRHQYDDLARDLGGALAAVGVTSLADARRRVKGEGKVKKQDDRGHNKHKNNRRWRMRSPD